MCKKIIEKKNNSITKAVTNSEKRPSIAINLHDNNDYSNDY